MDARCCAYSYLKEQSTCCDYEITTDQLVSDLALAKNAVKHIKELDKLVELIYHCNGSIRGKLAITTDDFNWLSEIYEQYQQLAGVNYFVVPSGSVGACHLHHCRVLTKSCVRLAYKIEKEGIRVDKLLFNFLNLLSNTLFMMALVENKKNNIDEIPFISKSYEC